jgi:hypothetical protein
MRVPFTNASVNLAGKPAKLGGTLAGALGAVILIGGAILALTVGVLVGSFVSVPGGLAIGVALGFFAIVAGLLLLYGGRSLWRSGASREQSTQERALFALASQHGWRLRADDVAEALDMTREQADAHLTALAKREIERVTVELDDDGQIFYRFDADELSGWAARSRMRVSPPYPMKTRVAAPPAPVPEEFEEEEARIAAPRRAAHSRA